MKKSDLRSLASTSLASTPHWREDFPVNWEEDHYVTRRAFTAFLTLISGALFLGTGLVALREWWQRWQPARLVPARIAQVGDLGVGAAKLFYYPTANDPCLLIRLSADRFVAYSQKCTHLQCPVLYKSTDQQLYCPCHAGFFSAKDGRPLAGPPKRPLPRILLTARGEEIWATGVQV